MKYSPKYARVLFGNVWVYAFVSETCSLGKKFKGIFVTCHKFPRALWPLESATDPESNRVTGMGICSGTT